MIASARRAILINLLIALALVGGENLLILSGWGFSGSGLAGGRLARPIPGWIIGFVWTGLFAGLGVVRGLTLAEGSRQGRRAGRAVAVLLIACAAYPFYTFGLRSDAIGLAGNLVTIGLSVWTAFRVGAVRRAGVVAPLAVTAWLLAASAALIDQMRLI
jgi:tryptophan-rich sensory protein